jgi:hypothetical protein
MERVADLIRRVVVNREEPARVADDVSAFVGRFTELKFVFESGTQPYAPVC